MNKGRKEKMREEGRMMEEKGREAGRRNKGPTSIQK
jgi:hypothetical protein